MSMRSPKGRLLRAQSGQECTDPHELIRLLQAQQKELELQNQALRSAHQEAEQSRAHYQDLYDFAPVAFFTLSDKGIIEQTNLAGAALFGRPRRSELVGKPFVAVARMKNSEPFWRHLRQCMDTGQRVVSALSISIGGATLAVQIESIPLSGDGAVVTGCRSAIVDMTDRQRAEDAITVARATAEAACGRVSLLSEVSSLFASALPRPATLTSVARLVVPALADGCIVELADRTSDTPAVAWASPERQRGAALLGQSGMFVRRVRATKRPELHESMTDALLKELADSHEHLRLLREVRLQSCVIVPVAARGRMLGALTLLAAESGRHFAPADLEMAIELGGRMGLFLDHARLHHELDAALQTRDEVLRVVSHDLHNSLAAASLQAQALHREMPSTGQLREHAAAIDATITVTRRLVNDLLDLADLEHGKLPLRIGPQDAAALIRNVIASLAPTAHAKGVALEEQIDKSLSATDCDRDRISQVLLNLIGNAIKFTPRGRTVVVSARVEASRLSVRVQDSGPGVAPEDCERVFEKFWHSGADAGSGLGLFIAKGIVEAHGGKIWVERPSTGAVFCFVLPTRELPTNGAPTNRRSARP